MKQARITRGPSEGTAAATRQEDGTDRNDKKGETDEQT